MGKFSLIFLFMFILGTAFCHYEFPHNETKPDDDYKQDDVNVSKVEEPEENELLRKVRNCGGNRCRSNSRCLRTCRFKCVRRQSDDSSDIGLAIHPQFFQLSMLQLHNEARKKVAAGLMPCADGKFLPNATSMTDLVWDEELAKGAQKLATSHENKHNTKTAPSGTYVKFTYGQNLFSGIRPFFSGLGGSYLSFAVNTWVNESTLFPLNKLDFYESNPDTRNAWSHFTQVCWGETTRVGCGFSISDVFLGRCIVYVVCNYYPPGNYCGEKVYEH